MDGCPQALRPNIHVDYHALGFIAQARISIRHGQCHHFVGACYDLRELAFLFILPFHYCFDYGRVVRAEVDEAVGYAKFPNCFEEGVGGGVPCIVLAFTTRVALRLCICYEGGNPRASIHGDCSVFLGRFR